MSIYVVDFSTWEVVHDDAPGGAHSGVIDPATIQHTQNMDSSPNHNFLVVTCPECGAVSTHPVGGGAQPISVQQLFVQLTQRNGCPDGDVPAGDTSALAASHVRLLVNRMDGPGRWQIAGPPSADKEIELLSRPTGATFEVAYRLSDSLIAGMIPEGSDVGSGYSIATINTTPEYDVLMATTPAYLSEDLLHVEAAPPGAPSLPPETYVWSWSNSTALPPNVKQVRSDTGDWAAATTLYISNTDFDGGDRSGDLAALGGQIHLEHHNDASRYATFGVITSPQVDAAYTTIGVALQASGGSQPGSGTQINVTLTQT